MSARAKLPVPAAWQPAVLLARDHLAGRLSLPPSSIAVTRADDAAAGVPGALDVWLTARGRTYRYVVSSAGAQPVAPADAAARP